jgi:hypothetical protein
MRLSLARTAPAAPDTAPGQRRAHSGPHPAAYPTCLQCGVAALDPATTFCRRCGLPYGATPRADAALPSCPVCYRSVEDDGRIPARHGRGRLSLVDHIDEHGQWPVGDDDYLESLRVGDRVRIGRFQAPFDLVRRYLVTGSLDGGFRRAHAHNAIVTAMAQIGRWGTGAVVLGDQPEWHEAREAVAALMERYAIGRR